MRLYLLTLTVLFTIGLQGCGEEQKPKAITKVDENKHPRLSDPDPRAWDGLLMNVVISDFQQSDGIFSSFICDEINKRLSVEPSISLKELNSIDKKLRSYAFKICLSPEGEDPSRVVKAIGKYSDEYPDLIKEINRGLVSLNVMRKK